MLYFYRVGPCVFIKDFTVYCTLHISENLIDTKVHLWGLKYMDSKNCLEYSAKKLLAWGLTFLISTIINCSPERWLCKAETCRRSK
jgi:hypothetical protein